MAFQVGQWSAGDAGLIPRSEKSPGVGNAAPLQWSCLSSPWTEEPGRLHSVGSQRVRHNWARGIPSCKPVIPTKHGFAPSGHFTVCFLMGTTGRNGVLLASSELEAGLLLNILQSTRQSPKTEFYSPKYQSVATEKSKNVSGFLFESSHSYSTLIFLIIVITLECKYQ